MADSMDYMAYINKAEEIARRLYAPDVFAPETVEVMRGVNSVRGDELRARQALSYARDALAAYLPNDPLVGEADAVLNGAGR